MNAPSKTEVEAPYVLREDRDGVATLTLNRGDRMNPLSTAMLSALQAELDRVAKDADTKVVVLAGAGKHFCAGHDLREMRSHPGKPWQKALFEQCSQMMLSLVRLPQPVIARVQGVAVAAGCQLVSMCDLAVMQPDGYLKIKDRAKDVIISGGENISSLEVEDVLYRHPAVLAAAVVAKPDPKWGETPCAFVEVKPGAKVTEKEIVDHCRAHLAHFKAPRHVVFSVLPKTSTGKIQKFVLRQQARSASAIE